MVVDVMEKLREGKAGGGHGDAGLRFALRFDPMRAGFPASALIGRLLGWSKNSSSRGSRLVAGDAAVIAAAVVLHSAALFMSDQQLRRARRRRLLAASGSSLDRTCSAARLRSLPAPYDGLRILAASDDAPLENVIHGTSIGAGDDEPVLVARVEMRSPADTGGEKADEEPEGDQSEQAKQLWLSLVEREQRLELRLMELERLREQEATVRELENRVSVSAVETRLLELKVSSLQEENERLKAQAAELDAVQAKLGRAKEKLQALKARAQDEATALRERVEELENNETEMEKEVAALREANAALEEKKTELALRLMNAGEAASPVNIVLDQEEANFLRESNEKLRRQIEQLHSDHCAHVEELVYLKWVNACLRHELGGNAHPSSAQLSSSTAMDLSKSMSYRSSEKAKQLMLRYGNLGMDGFDPAVLFSPTNESLYGDDPPVQSPDVSVAMAAPGKGAGHGHGKLKFLGSIKKLLASNRKAHGHRHDRRSKKTATTANDEHLEKAMRWLSSHDNSCESTPLSTSCERTPLSSVTTVDYSHTRARGGETAAAARMEPGTLSRSKSDGGAYYGRETSRYHALQPDHPAGAGTDGFHGRSRPS